MKIEDLYKLILNFQSDMYVFRDETKATLADHSIILQEHSKVLKQHSEVLQQHSETLQQHSEILQQHSKMLQQHSTTLQRLSHALINIEDTIKVYGDMYEINKDGIKALNHRVTALENSY